jgi:hypothetical protein
MPVNFLNLPGLDVVDFKEIEAEYHVGATPRVISRMCPHCGCSHETGITGKEQESCYMNSIWVKNRPASGKKPHLTAIELHHALRFQVAAER